MHTGYSLRGIVWRGSGAKRDCTIGFANFAVVDACTQQSSYWSFPFDVYWSDFQGAILTASWVSATLPLPFEKPLECLQLFV